MPLMFKRSFRLTSVSSTAEISGGSGRILPSVTPIGRQLTVWAGWWLAAVLVAMIIMYFNRGEYQAIVEHFLWLALLVFAATGSWRLVVIGGEQQTGSLELGSG